MDAPRHLLGLSCALALACGGPSIPLPVTGPEPAPVAWEDVTDPPPAGRPEIVSLSPHAKAVWVDGQWERVEGKWRWARGGWAIAPVGSRFTGFRVRRSKNGTLRFAAARWTDAQGQVIEVERLEAVQP